MHYQCTICDKTYAIGAVEYVCPDHGDQGLLNIVYDYAAMRQRTSPAEIAASREMSIWRYWDLLPLGDRAAVPPLQVGWTPLYHASALGRELGLNRLYLKDDGRNPTASFKDRASAVVVARARELGVEVITTASSGNAGAALAGLAASADMPAVIFVPEAAPPAKVAQLLIFGARVLLVRGTYDEASDLCLAASREFGWYNRNTGYNPFTTEGKKTCALEICEQLADKDLSPTRGWRAPDRIFVSVGDGNIISGIWKGLRDLLALGWIDKMPQLMGVQAEGSAACFNAWRAGTDVITPVDAHTVADSINVGLPRDGRRAVRAVRATGGEFITVSDAEILDAIPALGRGAAVFAEPAAAAAYAGLVKAARAQTLDADELIVLVITGNGLKDVKSAMQVAGQPTVIEPTLDALRLALHPI